MDKPTIGFIGLGKMGWPMASRLVNAGFTVLVNDKTSEIADQFASEFCVSSISLGRDAARACNVVVTMLPTSSVVSEVLCDSEFGSNLEPGTLIIEMSSGAPAQTIEISNVLATKGVRFIDAPVSGGVKRAETGELAIMVGGSQTDVEDALTLLNVMGSNVLHTGDVGSAHAMKALNNLVSATGFIAGVEALMVGKKFGLDPVLMVDVLNASSGMNFSTQKKLKQFVLSKSFNSGFGLDLMVKDLDIAIELARQTGTSAPVSSICQQVWKAAQNYLGPGKDHTLAAQLSELFAGEPLVPRTEGDRSASDLVDHSQLEQA